MKADCLTRLIRHLGPGIAAAIPAIALLAPHLSYVPMWDGGDYLERLRFAALSGFHSPNYFLTSHTTFLFALLMSVPVELFPSSIEALHIVSIALFALSVAAFRFIAERIRPGPESTAAAACYALCPLLLGNVLFFTPDIGVAFFFAIYLALLIRSPGPASALAGAMLANSKETGLALYAASVPIYVACFGWRSLRRSQLAFLLAPAAATILIYSALETPPARDDQLRMVQLSPFNALWHREPRAFLADIFVLSFSWIPSLVAVAGTRWRRGTTQGPARLGIFLWLMLAASAYIVTRFPTWNNPRYVIASCTLVFLLGYTGLGQLVSGARARIAAIALFAGVLILSNFRSFDPASSRLFHRQSLGESTVWNIQEGWTDLYLGPYTLREPMVYNLQYLNIHHLMNMVLRHVKPDAGTVFGAAREAEHWSLMYADPETHERVPGPPGIRLTVLPTGDERLLAPERPSVIHFVQYPNELGGIWTSGGTVELTGAGYAVAERRTFERNGYTIGYIRYERRVEDAAKH